MSSMKFDYGEQDDIEERRQRGEADPETQLTVGGSASALQDTAETLRGLGLSDEQVAGFQSAAAQASAGEMLTNLAQQGNVSAQEELPFFLESTRAASQGRSPSEYMQTFNRLFGQTGEVFDPTRAAMSDLEATLGQTPQAQGPVPRVRTQGPIQAVGPRAQTGRLPGQINMGPGAAERQAFMRQLVGEAAGGGPSAAEIGMQVSQDAAYQQAAAQAAAAQGAGASGALASQLGQQALVGGSQQAIAEGIAERAAEQQQLLGLTGQLAVQERAQSLQAAGLTAEVARARAQMEQDVINQQAQQQFQGSLMTQQLAQQAQISNAEMAQQRNIANLNAQLEAAGMDLDTRRQIMAAEMGMNEMQIQNVIDTIELQDAIAQQSTQQDALRRREQAMASALAARAGTSIIDIFT